MIAASTEAAATGDGLVLVAADLDSLTVAWPDAAAEGAASLRLLWEALRSRGEDDVGGSADLAPTVREHRIGGLEAGWRYRLRLAALDGDGVATEVARGQFFTLATAVRDLSARAAAHDAVNVRWRSPTGWSPVGYVLQWRRGDSPGAFAGSASLPPGRRSQLVTGLDSSTRYVFRVTALTARGWQSKPAVVRTNTRSAPASPLRLEVAVPAYCLADEGLPYSENIDPETLEPVWERANLAAVPLQWRVSGGTEPYTLTTPGARRQGATGTVEIPCTKAGADPGDPDADIIESGAKTFTISATDAAGASITRTVTVEIIEAAWSAGRWGSDELLKPGRVYYFDSRNMFIEIPEGARIGLGGSVLADPVPGSTERIPLDYISFYANSSDTRYTRGLVAVASGEEGPEPLNRHVCEVNEHGGSRCRFGLPLTDAENEMWDRFFANIRTTPFPEGDPRNDPPAPLFHSTIGGRSDFATAGSETTTVTAPGPLGRYTLGFDGFGVVHFGGTAAGQWRFSVVSQDTTLHGIPVGAGDLLISRQPASAGEKDPFDPDNFSPITITYGATTLNVTGCLLRGLRDGRRLCRIAAGAFQPLRIRYGQTEISATGCATHFYNWDRYECHIAGAFTFDSNVFPHDIAVNRAFSPRPPTPPPRATTGGPAAETETTCTTVPTVSCPPADG